MGAGVDDAAGVFVVGIEAGAAVFELFHQAVDAVVQDHDREEKITGCGIRVTGCEMRDPRSGIQALGHLPASLDRIRHQHRDRHRTDATRHRRDRGSFG